MHKINKYLLLFSIGLILLLSLSSVSAVDVCPTSLECDYTISAVDNAGDDSILESCDGDSDLSSSFDGDSGFDSFASSEEGVPVEENIVCSGSSSLKSSNILSDSNNGVKNNNYYVDNGNFNDFFVNNKLKSDYANATLVFNGSFDNFGVIRLYSNGTVVNAINSSFYNTVFDLGASGIVLSNVHMVLDKEFSNNEYSAIFVHADNVTVYNCTIDYNAPKDVTSFGIYSDGHHDDFVGLNIINNTINLSGDGNYNYGILLRNTHDSVVYGNTIDCQLPIKYINYAFQGIYGDASRDTDAALAADYCENLTLSNNYIHTNVNGGSNWYPTLDTVVLYGCSYSLIENNTILSEDFFTPIGQDNYLQALDLYNLNDVTIIGNNISVFTNGGKPGMGTAYPIQINGPVYNVKIAFNNLTTFNRGPNTGIYSQNFYGDTFIDIISNFINVTGDASNTIDGYATNPNWCLLSGIEAQDTGDNILNNTIIVNNLGDYKSTGNVYGISYVQNTGGGHTYNIQYNNITTNGNYGVKLIGKVKDSDTYNSTISNNVINTHTTSNRTGASTNRQVDGPSGTTVKNNTNGNPRNTMSEDYYPDWLKDYVRNGSGRGTGDFAWLNRILNPSSNGTGFSGAVGNGTSHSGSGNARGQGHSSSDGDVSGNGTDSHSDAVLGSDHDAAPGVGGDASPSISAASPSDSGSSAANPNAYEIDEHDNVVSKSSDYLQLGLICIVALLLLIIGYKRQKDKEEEE